MGPGEMGDVGNRPASAHDEAADGDGLTGYLRPALLLLANVAVITALLVYFGWARTIAFAHQIGINETVYLFSTRDYVLRSVGSVFDLLILVAVVGIAWLTVDRLVGSPRGREGGDRRRNRTGWATVLVAVLATAGVLVWLVRELEVPISDAALPALLASVIATLTYSVHLTTRRRTGPERARPLTTLDAFAAVALVACLFWATSLLAYSEGTMLGQRLDADPAAQLPRIELTSSRALHLRGEGIDTEELTDGAGSTVYRYSGLLLLGNTNQQLLVVPNRAPLSDGPVFVLTDDEDLRFDFVP